MSKDSAVEIQPSHLLACPKKLEARNVEMKESTTAPNVKYLEMSMAAAPWLMPLCHRKGSEAVI